MNEIAVLALSFLHEGSKARWIQQRRRVSGGYGLKLWECHSQLRRLARKAGHRLGPRVVSEYSHGRKVPSNAQMYPALEFVREGLVCQAVSIAGLKPGSTPVTLADARDASRSESDTGASIGCAIWTFAVRQNRVTAVVVHESMFLRCCTGMVIQFCFHFQCSVPPKVLLVFFLTGFPGHLRCWEQWVYKCWTAIPQFPYGMLLAFLLAFFCPAKSGTAFLKT